MKEIAVIKAQSYTDRTALVTALNNLGYGTRIEERKEQSYSIPPGAFYVHVYGHEE